MSSRVPEKRESSGRTYSFRFPVSAPIIRDHQLSCPSLLISACISSLPRPARCPAALRSCRSGELPGSRLKLQLLPLCIDSPPVEIAGDQQLRRDQLVLVHLAGDENLEL